MRQLLPKAKLRIVNLVDFLYFHNDWISLKEIAVHFECSTRTIKNDLATIREQNPEIQSEASPHGIRLRMAENLGIETFYRNVFKNLEIYELLEYLINNGEVKSEQVANHLFVSVPTLYRMINHYNPLLKKYYQISISTNPFSLTGRENHLRYIISQYYTESYSSCDWPFPSVDEDIIENLIIILCHHFNIELSFPQLRALKLTTTVNFLRTKQNRFDYSDYNSSKADHYYHSLSNDCNFAAFKKIFFNQFNLNLTQKTLTQLFHCYITDEYYLEYKDWLKDIPKNSKSKLSHKVLTHTIDTISSKFNLHINHRNKLLLNLHNAVHSFGKETRTMFLMSNRKKQFCSYIQKNYPLFYQESFNHIKKYCSKMGNSNDVVIHHLMYLFIVHWPNLITQIENNRNKLETLIVSDFDQAHAYFLKNIIDYNFKNVLNTTVCSYLNLDKLDSNFHHIDLIISNFALPKKFTESQICVDCVPTKDDLQLLTRLIEKLMIEPIRVHEIKGPAKVL